MGNNLFGFVLVGENAPLFLQLLIFFRSHLFHSSQDRSTLFLNSRLRLYTGKGIRNVMNVCF